MKVFQWVVRMANSLAAKTEQLSVVQSAVSTVDQMVGHWAGRRDVWKGNHWVDWKDESLVDHWDGTGAE